MNNVRPTFRRSYPKNREQSRALDVINRLRRIEGLKQSKHVIVQLNGTMHPVEIMLANKVKVSSGSGFAYSKKDHAEKAAMAINSKAELRGNKYVVPFPKSIQHYTHSVKTGKYSR